MTTPTPPNAPATVMVTYITSGTAEVTWVTAGTDVTSYSVAWFDNGVGPSQVANAGGQVVVQASSALVADITGLTNGRTYTFTVTSTSAAGTSAPSAGVTFLLAPPAPVPPAGYLPAPHYSNMYAPVGVSVAQSTYPVQSQGVVT